VRHRSELRQGELSVAVRVELETEAAAPSRKPTLAKKPGRMVPEGDSDASLEKKERRRARPATPQN
jgi:hypothetical protein